MGRAEKENVILLKFERLPASRQMGGIFTCVFAALRKLLCLRRRSKQTNDGHCGESRRDTEHGQFPPLSFAALPNQGYCTPLRCWPRWRERVLQSIITSTNQITLLYRSGPIRISATFDIKYNGMICLRVLANIGNTVIDDRFIIFGRAIEPVVRCERAINASMTRSR